MSEQQFTRPAANLASDAMGYVDAQVENVKLRSVKALSSGAGAVFWLLLVFIIAGVLVLTLSFAAVMWLGESLGSYAKAAFIVSGVLAVALVIVLLLRRVLFKGAFVSTLMDTFFPQGKERVRNTNELEKAILRNEVNISRQEVRMNRSFGRASQFYTNPGLYAGGIRTILDFILSFFGKKK